MPVDFKLKRETKSDNRCFFSPLQVREAETELAGKQSERQTVAKARQSTLLHGETRGDPGSEVATGEALLEQIHGASHRQHRYNYRQSARQFPQQLEQAATDETELSILGQISG